MQEATEEETGAEPGRNGPGPTGLAHSGPGSAPPFALGARLFIASTSAGRHIHPFIRVAETKEKHREEADGRRESSSCLGDGLGHALAAMVGPAW
jgi:hypothetical protein